VPTPQKAKSILYKAFFFKKKEKRMKKNKRQKQDNDTQNILEEN
jgi:hypothetical protein